MKPFSILALTSTLAALLLSGCNSHEAAVQQRIADANSRLDATPGGQLLAKAIEAHGGLDTWFTNGLLQFRWIYSMKDRGPDAVVDSVQTIDVWSSRAVHTVPGKDITFGWTGEQAWILPADSEFMPPPHFWSLTPFYFVGVPFVLADPGTNHTLLDEQLSFEGTDYPLVKVTFDPGTGETPDDYYTVMIHPETNQVAGVLYIVTDKTLYPDGPSEEKLLTYEAYTEVDGIFFPTKHRSFKMNDGQVGEEIRDAVAQDYKYHPIGSLEFGVRDGAKVY